MINPAHILDRLVAVLRDIPALVVEMGGDESRIRAYHDAYPTTTSYELAVARAPSPSIVVVWNGTGPDNMGQLLVWRHDFSLFVRARRPPAGAGAAAETGFYKIHESLVEGVPAHGNGLRLVDYQILDGLYPMEPPSMERRSDAEGVNFFEVVISFKETGA